ncbi:MAG: glycosyltransferase family 9 protein [Puniceicoccales bacterium]|jgi:ADP-heptose:LPS heptosyltransferase|nr:glycosyltransferase family 9 protein [Puniceicoccales bacterium]
MRVLVIKPSSLGDIVHGLQVMAIMKKHIGNLQIDWVVRDCFAEAIAASGIVDQVHYFRRGAGMFAFLKLLKSLRNRKYDAALDMQGLMRSGVMTFAARADRKIGRCDSRELAWMFYGEKVARSKSPHAIDILLQFLPKFGLEAKFEYALDLGVGKNSLPFGGQHVLLFPDSRRHEKQWPFFCELAESLARAYPRLRFAIVGQSPVHWRFSQSNVANLAGKTSLVDVLNLIKRCDLVVANDSAPAHIAAAMQRRIVVLFGPTNFLEHGPYPVGCDRHTTLSKRDLANLAVEDVFDACAIQIDNFLRSR